MTPIDAAETAVQNAVGEAPDERTELIAAKIHALMLGYHWYYSESGYVTESTEEEFTLPIVNPATGRRSRSFIQAGRFDGIVTLNGQRFLLEHKTTSEEIEDPAATYWRRLTIDSQISMYVLANWQIARPIDGTLYDVIRKPTTRQKEIAKGSQKKPDSENVGTLIEIEKFGTYYGGGVAYVDLDAIRAGWLTRENARLYHHRLLDDILKRPAWYFQRRIVPRIESDIVEFADELWDVAKDIHDATVNGKHYRNSDACMNWGSPCEYLGVCSGFDNPDSDRWRKREVHAELNTDARNVITQSRVKCFQLCRRKHYYRYILGIERADDEEREALFFGSLLHLALESWFNCFKENANGNADRLAANGVASPECPAVAG